VKKTNLGEVIAVGKGYYSVTGTFFETTLNVGDVVVLPTMGFSAKWSMKVKNTGWS
jgi:co-chaperonin GroES (HSP10)